MLREALLRCAAAAEAEGETQVEVEHLEKVITQLMLDLQ